MLKRIIFAEPRDRALPAIKCLLSRDPREILSGLASIAPIHALRLAAGMFDRRTLKALAGPVEPEARHFGCL